MFSIKKPDGTYFRLCSHGASIIVNSAYSPKAAIDSKYTNGGGHLPTELLTEADRGSDSALRP